MPETLQNDPNVSDAPTTVAMISLGCPKNLVDSEKMLGLLAEQGVVPVPPDYMDEGDADVVIVNTCGFLEASKEESLGEIKRAAELKKQGQISRLVVAGCLVQRHRARMLDWCPDIDAMVGVFDRDRITQAVLGNDEMPPEKQREKAAGNHPLPVYSSIAASAALARRDRGLEERDTPGYFEDDAARLRLTPRHWAYLRMSEGCNQNCAFCTIPSIRGKMRSKPIDRLLDEARELIDDGVQEISLIGQDTTSYGSDLTHPDAAHPDLTGLLEQLNDLAAPTGTRLRLMYAYPSCFTDPMIDAIASLPQVVKYIDMPLQHINDQVLDNMRRKTSRDLIETLLHKLRDRIKTSDGHSIAIRTTFISGFPGETDQQHQELVDFIRDFQFDNLGVFPYSPEPGTPAGTMYNNGQAIDDTFVQARLDDLMSTQQQIVFDRHQAYVDEKVTFDVMIDQPTEIETTGPKRGRGRYAARTFAQAPSIDGLTYVDSRQPLSPGEVITVRVTDFDAYDLVAQPIEDIQRKASLPLLRV